jgi:hypothetical protein
MEREKDFVPSPLVVQFFFAWILIPIRRADEVIA